MEVNLKRYLFLGEFDSILMGFFSKRGEVIWVSSLEEALNQTGNFTLIIVDSNVFKPKLSKNLSTHYPQTPILVSNGDKHTDPPGHVRFVKFEEIFDAQIMKEEKLARTELKVEELRKTHKKSKKLLILLHDHPDPDSIASALALRTLLKRNKQTAVIGHLGDKISRPENVAMIEILDINLHALDPEDLKEYDSISMVDVQPPFFGDLIDKVDSVIDHHPQVSKYEAGYQDISSVEGATSTIMTSYLRAAQVEISERLSTALLYGIRTDTVVLNRDANSDDIEAFTFLYPHANLGLLRKIERAEIPSTEIKCFGQALADHWIEKNIFFVNVGRVQMEYLIPKMADFGIQVKDIEWSVAFGILSNTHLVISVRNVGYVKSAGRLLRELFKDIGSAGGHRSAAKAVIPMSKVRKILGSSSQDKIKKWLTKIISEEVVEKNGNEN
jgi:nanoRNase/pAp phosphatase (c-di-AMP/oligoRNAs hydrolase)